MKARGYIPVLAVLIIALALYMGGPAFSGIAGTSDRKSAGESSSVFESGTDEYAGLRQNMVKTQIMARGISDPLVLEAMLNAPRHRFMPHHREQAYRDHPVPIGHGQTISQPYIVALMTEALKLDESHRVLEIGAGSGYQAAVLAEIVDEVYTIEIIKPLAEWAQNALEEQGYENVRVRHADGYFGWEEHAPYDAIIITASANHVPAPLLSQLRDGGRLILPLEQTYGFQTLTVIEKDGDDLIAKIISNVRFVPMTGRVRSGN